MSGPADADPVFPEGGPLSHAALTQGFLDRMAPAAADGMIMLTEAEIGSPGSEDG